MPLAPKSATILPYKMSAIHPVTGKPVRIMESEGCVWRDDKTLVWLNGNEEPGSKWNRYDVGVTSVDAWRAMQTAGIDVDVCVLLGPGAADWIRAKSFQSVQMFAISKAIIAEVGPEFFVKEGVANMICLDNAYELYPMLETPWDTTEADAQLIMALILQYKRTGPFIEAASRRSALAKTLGLSVTAVVAPPPKLHFITQFYVPPKADRAAEITKTLLKNAECEYIDRIILLNEQRYEIPIRSPKIEQRVIGHRLNFRTVFQHIYENVPRDTIVVIANADIFLDDSWRLIWSVSMRDMFLSLLRWDEPESPNDKPVLFGPRSDSQDTWAILSNSVKDRKWDWDTLDIPFGQNGCDNAINYEMLRNRMLVSNPCMSLVTHHLHNSGFRTYAPANIISKPIFLYLRPTGIHDLKPIYDLAGSPYETIQVPVCRPTIRCRNKAVFQSMLAVQEGLTEMIPAYSASLRTYENVIQTKDGLLQTYNSILIGKSKTVSDAWAQAEVNVLSPCVPVDVALVAHCPDEVANSPWKYMTQYLGKILHMNQRTPGEFLGTEDRRGVLERFLWGPGNKKTTEVPVLLRDSDFHAWCKKAHIWYPEKHDRVTKEEVTALRKSVLNRKTYGKYVVFCLDDHWITKEFVAAAEVELGCEAIMVEAEDAPEETMDLLAGAVGLVAHTSCEPLWGMWLLPKDAFVFEIQVEAQPKMDFAYLAEVCALNHFIEAVPRVKPQVKKDSENVLTHLTDFVKKRSQKPEFKAEILVPCRTTKGFFAHAGDSFREMVAIWAERGYVPVREVAGLSHVWFGGVGQVLLYDRPTLEWLHASPTEEQTWSVGLFGNPKPPAKGVAWSFWPRRPRIVEELALKPRVPFSERSRRVVFYGKSENAVQLRNRTKASWSSACTEFVHLDSAAAKYPYTHEEYLERLRGSLFGLCLAGYGKKCHREIECMAMGCVPVVAPEVDMTSYAVLPQEGVHYLRITGPDDLRAKTEAMSADAWEAMSAAAFQWWKENASAEGMWGLTKGLVGQ